MINIAMLNYPDCPMLIPEDLGSMSVHTAGMIIPQIIPLFLPSGEKL